MANVNPQNRAQKAYLRLRQLLIEEIEKGYTRESTLKADSWEYIGRRLNVEFASGQEIFNIHNLKRIVHTMKKRYNYFSALLTLNGVQWNIATNEVKAEDSVWKAYYKAHPKAPSYSRRGECHFDLLCRIFESGVCFD